VTRLKFGRVVELITAKSTSSAFKVGLEDIEAGTGKLRGMPVEYDGDGVDFRPDDVLFGKLRPYLAKSWLADRSGSAVGDFHVYRARPGTVPRYVHYVTLSRHFLEPVMSSVFGAKMPRASWDFVREVEIDLPLEHVQRTIADYLDRETAQIDTLIAKQEQLVSVLEERRALVIADTTAGRTKGAVTRSTGVEWLGETDSQWPVVRVRHIADVGTGYGDTIDAEPDGRYPFYVRSQTPQRSHDFDHVGPAVLTAGDGAGVAKVFHLATGQFKAHQRVYVINAFRGVLPEYFLAYFSAYFNRVALDGSAKSTVDSVRRSMITDMPIPLPPLDEQRRIVAYLDEQTAKIDTLIAKAQRFIELAKERRAALITAAVTGQLDVTAA
jgi:type I restriction enzyme S subunit